MASDTPHRYAEHLETGTIAVDHAPPSTRSGSRISLTRPPAPRPASVALEDLRLPLGLSESMLAAGARPGGAAQVRIAIVRIARQTAAEYRLVSGRRLRTDPFSVELLQRHLLALASEVDRGAREPWTMPPMIARYGVVFGEIIARALDALWTHLDGDRPIAWRMMLPSGVEVYPVARVHRFLLERNHEQDLVGFFLGLA
ncbi:MAG: hypothetical protein ACRELB_10205 [Polyangiaceae bacterium]